MALKTLKEEQSFDTLKLKVPAECFTNINWGRFSVPTKHNASTLELVEEPITQVLLDSKSEIKGLNTFTYVPHLNLFDLQISAKILREDYYQGITKHNISKVCQTLTDNDIVSGVDISEFIQTAQVLKADNTFNIPIEEAMIADYYDALSLVITQGTKGKIDVYGDRGDRVNGVVVGKDTKVLQKITIYDKMEEARVKLKSSFGSFDDNVKREYGMEGQAFRDYFNNKLRIELRVNDFNKLRKFYTNRSKGNVYLEDLLFSENNAILYQWNQFVSSTDTATAIKFLDMSYQDKMNYKLEGYSASANFHYLKTWIEKFNGDEKIVTDKIKKLPYYDASNGKYKKMSKSVVNDIIRFCSEYRQNQLKSMRGELFTSSLTNKFKEVDKKISNL
jgi:hypothetical protein